MDDAVVSFFKKNKFFTNLEFGDGSNINQVLLKWIRFTDTSPEIGTF